MKGRLFFIAFCMTIGGLAGGISGSIVFGLGDTRPAPAPAVSAPAPAPEPAAPAPASSDDGGDAWLLRAPRHLSQRVFDLGERLFFERVVCAACPFADLRLNDIEVTYAWRRIQSDLRANGRIGANLGRYERRAILLYIRQRFGR